MTRVKYIAPNWDDYVEPSFNFCSEKSNKHRIRQRDGLYAHEMFSNNPYDGVLVSKVLIDGYGVKGRFTIGQRERFYREGVYRYFRMPSSLWAMGDCGSFSYVNEVEPPFSVSDLIEFYNCGRFSHGIALDHVITNFESEDSKKKSKLSSSQIAECKRRQNLTLELASEFLNSSNRLDNFIPYGVAQGWSPISYAHSINVLQKTGYHHIALGGLVKLNTKQLLMVLHAVNDVRNRSTRLHLLGISRIDHTIVFANLGVTSFDSTTPLTHGFKATKENYYFRNTTYTAIGVPQTDRNLSLVKLIQSGKVEHNLARKLELESLARLIAFDNGKCSLAKVIKILEEYEKLYSPHLTRKYEYERTLTDQPWKKCDCEICKEIGIHVVIKRGAQRNRRRGFHNIYVTNQRLHSINGKASNER